MKWRIGKFIIKMTPIIILNNPVAARYSDLLFYIYLKFIFALQQHNSHNQSVTSGISPSITVLSLLADAINLSFGLKTLSFTLKILIQFLQFLNVLLIYALIF